METKELTIHQGWPENLASVAGFLDQNMDYDMMDADLLEEKLFLDPWADPELCFTAFLDNEMVGFLFCTRRSVRGVEYGYVKLMAVDKNHRRQKIATRLYRQAENLLFEKGARQIRWYDVPLNYFIPGIDPRYTEAVCFALKSGFKKFDEAVNMLVDLHAMDWTTQQEEDALQNKGVVVRRAKPEDMPAISELLNAEWQLWNNEVEMAMKDNPASVHIAFINGKLRAFSVHNGNNKGTGWFGPMGTHPDMRGLGIGSILLRRCLDDMCRQGHQQAVIPWVAPIAFYAHYAKARIQRVFWRMEKTLTEPDDTMWLNKS